MPERTSPAGILLAAGRGLRFGADKRWQPLADGTPMAVAAACSLAVAVAEVVVVLRPEDRELAERMRRFGCRPVFCAEAVSGMGHSLAAGVVATARADGWLVALADMPWIRPDSHLAVVAALRAGASQARACYRDRPGHPVGFSSIWQARLVALAGDRGARDLLDDRVLARCEVEDPGVLQDVDLAADLEAFDGTRAMNIAAGAARTAEDAR